MEAGYRDVTRIAQVTIRLVLEKMAVGRTMRHVARCAALNTTAQVLEDKGATLVRVTSDARLLLESPESTPGARAVLTVTIGACDHPLEHAVPFIEMEFGANLYVAAETGIGLRTRQQAIASRCVVHQVT